MYQEFPTFQRRTLIGGSDARIIMGDDETALIRLWQEKRGEVEPQDYSDNLIVQLGLATEALNRCWYERTTGRVIPDVQRGTRPPAALTPHTKSPGQSSKLSCPRTPKKPSAMGCGPNDRDPARLALIFWTRRPPMQRSSESLAALACALPKAQAQLGNPEKSLSAT